jgi:hypothetical protein
MLPVSLCSPRASAWSGPSAQRGSQQAVSRVRLADAHLAVKREGQPGTAREHRLEAAQHVIQTRSFGGVHGTMLHERA